MVEAHHTIHFLLIRDTQLFLQILLVAVCPSSYRRFETALNVAVTNEFQPAANHRLSEGPVEVSDAEFGGDHHELIADCDPVQMELLIEGNDVFVAVNLDEVVSAGHQQFSRYNEVFDVELRLRIGIGRAVKKVDSKDVGTRHE